MKSKLLNLGLLISSLVGYYEFRDYGSFLFQMEWETISKMLENFSFGLSPFVLLPMLGQLLLLFTLFQKEPGRIITYIAIGCLGLLLFFMFLIGIASLNYKIALSLLPFVVLAVVSIRYHRKIKAQETVV